MRIAYIGWSVVVAIAMAAVAGCDTAGRTSGDPRGNGDETPGVSRQNPPQSIPSEGGRPRAVEPPAPSNSVPREGDKARTAKRTAPPKSVPPRKPDPDSRALVGKSEAELTRLLGAPHDTRNEPPAVVWSYRAETCSLDVFLYFDVAQKKFRSLAYRFYPETRVKEMERACLAGIRTGRAKAPKSN